jgi:hypothetical protein
MALVNKTFSVNVTPGAMPPIVHVSEYDVGRAYTVSILDEQGNSFTIPSGTTASIEGTLNGAVGFTQSATVSNNQVSFTLSQSMTAYSGKAWCKIKLTQNSQPIQTCAFILAVDRAGVEADTVIGAPGFEAQIVDAVNDWLDEHPPASGGMTEEFKQALLALFNAIQTGWNVDNARELIAELEAALYPSKTLVSISAVFNQGSAIIYDTNDLNILKQYLTVTATYDDSSTGVVTNYTLSGTLTEGTSVITVAYKGKTTTFNVTVEHNPLPSGYTKVNYLENTSTSAIKLPVRLGSSVKNKISAKVYVDTDPSSGAGYGYTLCGCGESFSASSWGTYYQLYLYHASSTPGRISEAMFPAGTNSKLDLYGDYYGNIVELESVIQASTPKRTLSSGSNSATTDYTTENAFNYDLNLFCNIIDSYQDTRTSFIGRIYSFSLEKNDTKVLDLVPCYRNSDNKPGMYDTVSNTFLVNSGGGEFTWG